MQVESMVGGLRKANRLGGVISLLVLVLCILIFLFRLGGMSGVGQWLGIVFLATAIPFAYLYYILKIEFRSVKWMTVLYVMFFFAGTGGLIGIASLAGKRWSAAAIVLFLLMTLLAFWQRGKTGM